MFGVQRFRFRGSGFVIWKIRVSTFRVKGFKVKKFYV